MGRENAIEKGRRYAAEGRLIIEEIDPRRQRIDAMCRGDGASYRLGWRGRGGWWCTCPARSRCSHLYALGLVVAVDRDLD